MHITKIERQKKRSSRKSIFIDGSFAFGVSDDILLKFALHEGALLDEGTIEKIVASDHEEAAKQKALRFLAIRPRSKREIRDYLLRKEFSEEIAERIIERLEALRMLDDAAFARMVCRDALAKKPAGSKLLRQMLIRKGVPPPLIESVLTEFSYAGVGISNGSQSGGAAKRANRAIDEAARRRSFQKKNLGLSCAPGVCF